MVTTHAVESRKTQPQKRMKPPSVARPLALSMMKPTKARKWPSVCPIALHVAPSSLLRALSTVSASPSTAMSCVAAKK
jgi:hypothetical protein